MRATALGKKFKPTPFTSYHELFDEIEDAQTLGTGSAIRKIRKTQSMATKAVLALGGDVPVWLKREIA
ncbi:MAG: hypothetical protein II336_15265 [Loktanella sp.]|nr:hypothetical protein [Loktanella sp.]